MAPSVRLRRVGLAAVALASVFLLSACNPSGNAAGNFSGLPVAEEEVEGPAFEESEEPQVAWWEEGGQLALVIYGSSTCPSVGQEIRVLEPAGEGNRVAIDLVQRPEDEVCTMDFVPHTTLFWTPVEVTTTEPLIVEVAGFDVEVPIK